MEKQSLQEALAENARLKEQVDLLTTALVEALAICAKWSGLSQDQMREQFEQECG